ncbi:MAG: hypothetical protein M3Q97_11415 [Bacteroidota bacterium]|nr:hypothetical protein [Bacteroidota bacterium]
MERDDEVKGSGNSYTAEFWQYDARLGRRWNLDPVTQFSISNYACFANNPIYFSDPNGDTYVVGRGKNKKTVDVSTDNEGNVSVKYEEGTKERLKRRFERKTLPVLQSMAKTEIGREAVNHWNTTQTQVRLQIVNGFTLSSDLGNTGSPDQVLLPNEEYERIKVKIYKRNLQKAVEDPESKWYQADWDEIQGAVGTHERYHNHKDQIAWDLMDLQSVPPQREHNGGTAIYTYNAEYTFRIQYRNQTNNTNMSWRENYHAKKFFGMEKTKDGYIPKQQIDD